MSETSPKLFATDTYKDFTSEFKQACESLPPSGLQEAPGFKLTDVLSSSQVGIPKIDTGASYTSLESDLSEVKIDESDQGTSDFIESLFCAHMAFLDGHSLVSTVLSNPSVEKMFKTRNVELTPDFISIAQLAALKSVQVACEIASNGALYPEEDMYFAQVDFSYLETFPIQQVVTSLDQARKQARQQNYTETALALERWSCWLTVLNHGIKKTGTAQKLQTLAPNKADDLEFSKWHKSNVQSRMDYTCFKEPPKTYNIGQMKASLSNILAGIISVSPVFKIERSTDLSGFLLQFCTSRRPALVRAMVNSHMPAGTIFGKAAKTWTKMDIEETSPHRLPKHPAFEEFLTNASLCYQDLLHIFMTNRCRVREGLNALVLSYDSLQVQATELDLAAGAQPLSNWVLLRKLQAMLWVVLLSFDLELVQTNEIAATYFVAHQICQAMLAHLGQMRTLFETMSMRSNAGHAYLASLVLETEMIAQLCASEYMLFFAIYKQTNTTPISKQLYELRLASFATIGVPQLPTYEDYTEASSNFEIETCLQGSGSHALTVRNLATELQKMVADNEDLPLLKRSAFGLSIAVSQIVKNDGKIEKFEVDIASGHRYFVTPKLQFFK